MAQSARVRKAAASGRALQDANFLPKRERKAIRKGLVRAALANRVADIRIGAAARAEFYRNLRLMKMRRILISKQMFVLEEMVSGLNRKLDRTADHLSRGSVRTAEEKLALSVADDALGAGQVAERAVWQAAGEFSMFAKRKIYYTEVAG